MKNILGIMILIALISLSAYAATNIIFPSQISFINKTFVLKYSKKMPQFNSYMNEYYLPEQKYDNWTELIGVFDYPNANSPIQAAEMFVEHMKSKGQPAELIINEKENKAIAVFMAGKRVIPTKIELNIFKYEKNPNGGLYALQYARRYFINNEKDIDKMTDDINKNKSIYINLTAQKPIPKLIEKEYDLGK